MILERARSKPPGVTTLMSVGNCDCQKSLGVFDLSVLPKWALYLTFGFAGLWLLGKLK